MATKTTTDITTVSARSFDWVLKKPIFSEKASQLGSQNTYTFQVDRSAVKADIVAAIKVRYNVTPIDVRVINTANRTATVRGRRQTVRGSKKALVVLSKGSTIDFTA